MSIETKEALSLHDADYLKRLGARIRYFRKKKRLTQADLEHAAGYSSNGTLSQIERGEKRMPRDKLLKVADALGVHPYVLECPEPLADDDLDLLEDFMYILAKQNRVPEFRSLRALIKTLAKRQSGPDRPSV